MARIILEDMKLNKNRRSQTSPKEATFSTYLDLQDDKDKKVKEQKKDEERIEEKNKEIKQKEKEFKEEIISSLNLLSKEVEDKEKEREEAKVEEYIESRKKKESRFRSTPQVRRKPRPVHKTTIIVFVVCLILGGAYWSGNVFQKANVTITSKHQLLNYTNKVFTAGKNTNNNVDFEIMITPIKKKIDIVLTEPKEVSIKASGSINLYNEFSTKSEKLSLGTFVSDNGGKAYKTSRTVTRPGHKLDKNKKIIPGQVSVGITAFLAGETYNGSPESFHINSFKGTSKYNKIYGKLKTPITGGVVGLVYTPDDTSKKSIDNIANTSFKEELINKVKTLIPEGYILYPDAVTFSYSTGDTTLSKTPESNVEIDGTLSVVLLNKKSLIDNIISMSLPAIKADEAKEITIPDLNKLSFAFTNKDQIISKDISSIPFSLNGIADVVWNPDVNIIKTKLIGIPKSDVLSVFRQDPGISSAMVKIFPPWQKNIPTDETKINIKIE